MPPPRQSQAAIFLEYSSAVVCWQTDRPTRYIIAQCCVNLKQRGESSFQFGPALGSSNTQTLGLSQVVISASFLVIIQHQGILRVRLANFYFFLFQQNKEIVLTLCITGKTFEERNLKSWKTFRWTNLLIRPSLVIRPRIIFSSLTTSPASRTLSASTELRFKKQNTLSSSTIPCVCRELRLLHWHTSVRLTPTHPTPLPSSLPISLVLGKALAHSQSADFILLEVYI